MSNDTGRAFKEKANGSTRTVAAIPTTLVAAHEQKPGEPS